MSKVDHLHKNLKMILNIKIFDWYSIFGKYFCPYFLFEHGPKIVKFRV